MAEEKSLRKLKQRVFQRLLDYRGERQLPATINSAVIFVARHIGDTMAVYPAIRALQAAKAHSITIVVNPSSYAALAPLEAEGVHFIHIPHERDKRAAIDAARQIKRSHGKIDLCLQAMMRDTTATLLFQRTLRARCNLGLHHSSLQMYIPHVADTSVAMHDDQVPVPICWAQLMKDANIAEVTPRFELPIPKDIDASIQALIASYRPYIALNLDASQAKRSLSAETAIQLIQTIQAACGYQVIITCAPAGEEKAQRVAQACSSAHVLNAPRSIYHSAAIIKYAAAVISPDTSIVHIASAYNRPTIGMYLTKATAWGPLADRRATLITNNINDIDKNAFIKALEEVLPES